MKILVFSILNFLALASAKNADDCKTGETWAEGKIKMLCADDGVKPIACLPLGKVGQNELKSGQFFTNTDIKFKCSSSDEWSMSYDPVACVLPNDKVIVPGKEEGIGNKGLYKCIANKDGSLTRKDDRGCYFGGKLYEAGTIWKNGESQVVCIKNGDDFDVQGSGCYLPNGEVIKVNSFAEVNKAKFKCAADAADKKKTALVKASDDDYNAWLNGNKGGNQVTGLGGHATGARRTTTTSTTTTTPTTTTTTTKKPTTTPTTTTTKPTTTTQKTTTTPKCVDLHPNCPDLCSKCDEDVGWSLRRKRMFITPNKCPIVGPVKTLINNICPKSCGFCGQENLQKAAEKFVGASCIERA